ncbi:LysR family transcriptional regulator [Vibrio mexicanus]|uniref:LysR family transcriptional regulator n=1 Tax=Vibrio mexicanus TaxID=1004326 RepID=UPI00063C0B42|nr:LysR family transcriptional regulator [Vibrio mexicanus]
MEIESLKAFLAFVETGSFTRAAKHINRTQSAFSSQMKKLEEELNVRLFEKEGRNLVLSEAGLALQSHAEQLVTAHNLAVSQIKRYQDKRAFRLGCPEDYNSNVLARVVSELQKYQPTCSIQIYSQPSTVLRGWIDEGKLDAAIVTRAAESDEGIWLASDKGVWVKSKSYEVKDDDPLPIALYHADCKYHSAALNGLSKVGRAYQLLACCDSSSGLRALVEQGLCVGAMGELSVSKELTPMTGMPPLPAVDIALISSGHDHPLLTAISSELIKFEDKPVPAINEELEVV